jgi:polysaccharide biosynthesis protein PslG
LHSEGILKKSRLLITLALALIYLMLPGSIAAAPTAESPVDATAALDYDITNGHFFTQTNGSPLGTTTTGYAVTNDDGIAFWDAYTQLGGASTLGYPATGRFMYDGFVTQAMQKVVFQWRPEVKQVWFLNTFDALHDKAKDDWLLVYRQTPKPFDVTPDIGLSWDQVVKRHQAFLDQSQAIKTRYFADPDPVSHFGLPVAYADMGNSFVIRAQRATFQFWKEDVPWAKKGDVTVANGGDLAKEAGFWPQDATTPAQSPTGATPASLAVSSPTAQPAPTSQPAPTAQPAATSTTPPPAAVPVVSMPAGVYRAKSPEYGMNIFILGAKSTTQRDLAKVTTAGFSWQKSLFQWRQIEGAGKGKFDWTESDRVVAASATAGIKIIARLDFQPAWARADGANNGPPDNYNDYGDFVNAFVNRYKTGSPYGRVQAIEIWNEPNLAREWGDKTPNAGQYVQLLKTAYTAAKKADPNVTVITAGLTPTETYNSDAFPDDLFLQQMYDAGAKAYFDVLGAHGAGYKAPPQMSPDQVAADPTYGGHRFFCFRRIEDLHNVMVKNNDSSKQIWLLEFGWTSDTVHPAYAWHAVTEDQKSQYIVDAYKWAADHWSPWIGVMTLWNLPAPDWNQDREEYWWSISNPDGTDRPAYTNLLHARQSGYLP